MTQQPRATDPETGLPINPDTGEPDENWPADNPDAEPDPGQPEVDNPPGDAPPAEPITPGGAGLWEPAPEASDVVDLAAAATGPLPRPHPIVALEDTLSGQRLIFPSVPKEIPTQIGSENRQWRLEELGSISLPSGRTERKVRLEHTFWGPARQYLPFIHDWQAPANLVLLLAQWVRLQPRGFVKLQLTTPTLEMPCFISDFTHTQTGAFGDIGYSLELTERRTLSIRTVGEARAPETGTEAELPATTTTNIGTQGGRGQEDIVDPPAVTNSYTVQSGDSLITIASKLYADSTRWRDLYDANADTIGPDPNLLEPGMQLSVPGATGPTAEVDLPPQDSVRASEVLSQ